LKKTLETKVFGKTGLRIPSVIYGTSYLGNLYKELPWETKLAIMKEWFAHSEGTVVIDSAGKYGAGLALETMGKGLKVLGIPESRVLISVKLGWYRVPLITDEPTFEPGAFEDRTNDPSSVFKMFLEFDDK
jgi:D-threo-aldose 1-dehydrogenase